MFLNHRSLIVWIGNLVHNDQSVVIQQHGQVLGYDMTSRDIRLKYTCFLYFLIINYPIEETEK